MCGCEQPVEKSEEREWSGTRPMLGIIQTYDTFYFPYIRPIPTLPRRYDKISHCRLRGSRPGRQEQTGQRVTNSQFTSTRHYLVGQARAAQLLKGRKVCDSLGVPGRGGV